MPELALLQVAMLPVDVLGSPGTQGYQAKCVALGYWFAKLDCYISIKTQTFRRHVVAQFLKPRFALQSIEPSLLLPLKPRLALQPAFQHYVSKRFKLQRSVALSRLRRPCPPSRYFVATSFASPSKQIVWNSSQAAVWIIADRASFQGTDSLEFCKHFPRQQGLFWSLAFGSVTSRVPGSCLLFKYCLLRTY